MSSKDTGVSPVEFPQYNRPLIIELLDYKNPYDYHKPHRHDYFEIILVEQGEGKQFIDFAEYKISIF